MAESKPANPNGAYYGGAQGIPTPPQNPPQAYYSHGRGHRSCGCCCIIGTLLKLIVSIVVILGIAALIIWLVLRPSAVKFYVEDVSLTQFNLANTSTLHYDLKLNVSIRNPNRKIGIDYDKLEVAAYYADERFGWVQLPGFYQGHKNTSILQTAFKGQSLMVPGDSIANIFNEQKASGSYYVDVKIKPKMRFKIGQLKTTKYSPNVWCYLEVPLNSVNSSSPATGGFTRTKCDVDYF
ncbi:NDR1/HIN1-like protein 3 [Nymphaea colorata]|uniref:NDR1/HIN1-like protein 3 n=1 Tax=Nymphaea colorata TaxID=210225 RepID=UPI00129E25C2|nr:NDR1/HIN1-like protein 3 [Nymphaea colorata]